MGVETVARQPRIMQAKAASPVQGAMGAMTDNVQRSAGDRAILGRIRGPGPGRILLSEMDKGQGVRWWVNRQVEESWLTEGQLSPLPPRIPFSPQGSFCPHLGGSC